MTSAAPAPADPREVKKDGKKAKLPMSAKAIETLEARKKKAAANGFGCSKCRWTGADPWVIGVRV